MAALALVSSSPESAVDIINVLHDRVTVYKGHEPGEVMMCR